MHADGAYIPDDHAIDLHVASGLRWLLDDLMCVWMSDRDGQFCVGRWNESDCYAAPTLFLALHAAIIATKGDDQ